MKLKNLLVDLAGTLLIILLFGCGTSRKDLTAHNDRGPLAMVIRQPVVWILGDTEVQAWASLTAIPYWTFYPPSGKIVSDPSDDVLGMLNHLLLGTPTGDPSDLPAITPPPAPDVVIVLTGTDDLIDFVAQGEKDHGPCQGLPGDDTSPEIPTSPCEAYYGLVTQAHQASVKIVLTTLPLTLASASVYTPALHTAEVRYNAYLTEQGLTTFKADAIIDLSATLTTGSFDGRTFNKAGSIQATNAVSVWVDQQTSAERK